MHTALYAHLCMDIYKGGTVFPGVHRSYPMFVPMMLLYGGRVRHSSVVPLTFLNTDILQK